jgi:hypothetical protein
MKPGRKGLGSVSDEEKIDCAEKYIQLRRKGEVIHKK